MVEILFSSSSYWYFIHGSIMYITHLKRYSKTMYEVEKKYRGEGIISMSFFFSKLRKNWIRVSGYKATKSAKVCIINLLNVHNRQTDRQTDRQFIQTYTYSTSSQHKLYNEICHMYLHICETELGFFVLTCVVFYMNS